MAETALALGIAGHWEYEGKSHIVAVRTLEMESLFEVFLEKRALDVVRRHAPMMNGREYQANMDGWRQDCAIGVYSWGSVGCENARYTAVGAKYMAYLQLKVNDPTVTEEFIDRVSRDESLRGSEGKQFTPFKELLDYIYGRLDPNPPPDAGKTA